MFFRRHAFKETSGVSIPKLDFNLPMVDMAPLKRLKYPRFDRIRLFCSPQARHIRKLYYSVFCMFCRSICMYSCMLYRTIYSLFGSQLILATGGHRTCDKDDLQ